MSSVLVLDCEPWKALDRTQSLKTLARVNFLESYLLGIDLNLTHLTLTVVADVTGEDDLFSDWALALIKAQFHRPTSVKFDLRVPNILPMESDGGLRGEGLSAFPNSDLVPGFDWQSVDGNRASSIQIELNYGSIDFQFDDLLLFYSTSRFDGW